METQQLTGTQMIRKCLFPAAGYGTRFLPATKAMPKEMLPIVDKPLIQYGVEEAVSAGMKNICMVTGRGKRALADHFDTSYELEHQIKGSAKEAMLEEIRELIDQCIFTYTRQIEMLGLGHAVLTGEALVGDEPFGVILADDLCINPGGDSVMQQMAKIHEEHKCCVVAIEEVPMEEIHKYGVIAGEKINDDLYRITDMVEKPAAEEAPTNLAIIGRYILTPEIFDVIRNTPPGLGGEIQLTDALLHMAKEGKVLGYRFKGQRYDCGSLEGFVKATNAFYEMKT
jgi:UTP--glucose-1-phosphate uridylyltransferase